MNVFVAKKKRSSNPAIVLDSLVCLWQPETFVWAPARVPKISSLALQEQSVGQSVVMLQLLFGSSDTFHTNPAWREERRNPVFALESYCIKWVIPSGLLTNRLHLLKFCLVKGQIPPMQCRSKKVNAEQDKKTELSHHADCVLCCTCMGGFAFHETTETSLRPPLGPLPTKSRQHFSRIPSVPVPIFEGITRGAPVAWGDKIPV